MLVGGVVRAVISYALFLCLWIFYHPITLKNCISKFFVLMGFKSNLLCSFFYQIWVVEPTWYFLCFSICSRHPCLMLWTKSLQPYVNQEYFFYFFILLQIDLLNQIDNLFFLYGSRHPCLMLWTKPCNHMLNTKFFSSNWVVEPTWYPLVSFMAKRHPHLML